MTRNASLHRKALVLAIGLGFAGMSTIAFGQATRGTIFGSAPISSGETVVITGGAGFNRTVTVSPTGKYTVTLPVGVYTVTLEQNGKVIQSHAGVTPPAAGATEVNFTTSAANAESLSAVTVSANSIPVIDVGSTTVQTTITAQQLDHLPIGRSAEAIAMLAPGVTMGASANGRGPTGSALLSFGGSSVNENAYYIDGMDTTDPLANLGGIALPYNSIQQEQILIAGYGAKYGQSTGGVINMIGKSGTNTWHFGGRVLWRPKFGRANPVNVHWSNPRITSGPQADGKLQQERANNNLWQTTYDAYLGGPLVKNKLFLFVSAEWEKTKGNTVSTLTANNESFTRMEEPKYYAKLNWNINQNNILSVTGVYNAYGIAGDTYSYNNETHQSGDFQSANQATKNAYRVWVGNYTSYITPNLTLHAMYGKMDGDYLVNQPAYAGFDPSEPAIQNAANQDPSKSPTGAAGVISKNLAVNIASPKHHSEVTNERLNLTYDLGINTFSLGIDNVTTYDEDGGLVMTGPGYSWEYEKGKEAGKPVQGAPGSPTYVPPPPASANGFLVSKYVFVTASSIKVAQRSQYFQDKLQATPRLLLNLGIRRSAFTNYNAAGQPYVRIHNGQWAPRLGLTWDVYGDSSLKVFANAGRYYLALPPGPGLRLAGSGLYSQQFYTYQSINADGIPQGLTPVGTKVFENGANGQPIDHKTASAVNAKAEYQDSFVAGFQKKLPAGYVGGVTLRYSTMGRILDDWDDQNVIKAAAQAAGINPDSIARFNDVIINPGQTAKLREPLKSGGYVIVPVSAADTKLPKAKRDYWSVDLSLSHPWNGKWMGKVEYVLSHSYGNTEGGVQSNIGQAGNGSVDLTEQWDYWQLMSYAGGDQANDRRHVFKAFGVYQIAPDWLVSANLLLEQGTPRDCLGFFGPPGTVNDDPVGYATGFGGAYHFCGGKPTPPGSTGRTPWLHVLSLGVEFRPSFADHKLAFQLQVHNVFNEQKPIQYNPYYGTTSSPWPSYKTPFGSASTGAATTGALTAAQFGYETPRYIQLGVIYNY